MRYFVFFSFIVFEMQFEHCFSSMSVLGRATIQVIDSHTLLAATSQRKKVP